jgi:hypothetical protein
LQKALSLIQNLNPMTFNLRLLFTCMALMLLFGACKKKKESEAEPEPVPSPLPVVSTSGISSIGPTSASGGGQVSSEGSSAVTDVGICWDTDHNPTTLKPHTNNGAGTGSFQANITDLLPNTTYYVRAYARNASGVAYGNEVSFKTLTRWAKAGTASFYVDLHKAVCIGETLFAVGRASSSTNMNDYPVVSTDGGKTWTKCITGLPSGAMGCSNLLLRNNVLFVAIKSYAFFPDAPYIYTSADHGANWMLVMGAANGKVISKLFANPAGIYGVTENDGIFLSTDNGANWNAVNNGLGELSVMDMAVGNSALFAATETKGVYVSTNNGSSWTAANTGLGDLHTYALAVSGSNILLEAQDGNYISSNNGNSWTKLNFSISPCMVQARGNYVFAYRSGGGPYLSSDNGATWRLWDHGLNLSLYDFTLNNTAVFGIDKNDNSIYTRALE